MGKKGGLETGYGFEIPSSWPKWKQRCRAHKRSSPEIQCKNWAIRGMPTCRRHGSGGAANAKLGTIRYLAWIIIGCPKDTPPGYAKWVALATAFEMMFNHGHGSVEQRMKAAMWLLESDEVVNNSREGKKGSTPTVRELLKGSDDSGPQDTGAYSA